MPPIGTLQCKLAGASSTSAHLAVQLIPSTSKNVGPGVITSKAELSRKGQWPRWLRRLRQSEESDAAAPFQRGGCCLPQLWSATLAVKHHKPLILSFFLQVFALRTSKPSGK